MKANRLVFTLVLLLSAAVFQLPAQQNEADGKLLSDIRVKAEHGDAESQFALGKAFAFGKLGVAKDYAEAVNGSAKLPSRITPRLNSVWASATTVAKASRRITQRR